jgi:hypothetical protein
MTGALRGMLREGGGGTVAASFQTTRGCPCERRHPAEQIRAAARDYPATGSKQQVEREGQASESIEQTSFEQIRALRWLICAALYPSLNLRMRASVTGADGSTSESDCNYYQEHIFCFSYKGASHGFLDFDRRGCGLVHHQPLGSAETGCPHLNVRQLRPSRAEGQEV